MFSKLKISYICGMRPHNKGQVYLSNNPFISVDYALDSPEWFYLFLNRNMVSKENKEKLKQLYRSGSGSEILSLFRESANQLWKDKLTCSEITFLVDFTAEILFKLFPKLSNKSVVVVTRFKATFSCSNFEAIVDDEKFSSYNIFETKFLLHETSVIDEDNSDFDHSVLDHSTLKGFIFSNSRFRLLN